MTMYGKRGRARAGGVWFKRWRERVERQLTKCIFVFIFYGISNEVLTILSTYHTHCLPHNLVFTCQFLLYTLVHLQLKFIRMPFLSLSHFILVPFFHWFHFYIVVMRSVSENVRFSQTKIVHFTALNVQITTTLLVDWSVFSRFLFYHTESVCTVIFFSCLEMKESWADI